MLKFSTLSIFLIRIFFSFNFSFMYFEDSSLGVHLFSIIMSSWQSYPFILMKCLPWPQVIFLILKSDIIRATPAFLSLMIELCIFCLFTSTYLYIWLWDIYLNILNTVFLKSLYSFTGWILLIERMHLLVWLDLGLSIWYFFLFSFFSFFLSTS